MTDINLQELLALCARSGASDLHLSAGQPPMVRIDGDIEPLRQPVCDSRQISAAVQAVAPQAGGSSASDLPSETDFCIDLPDVARFRVNVFRHQRGAGAVFRTVPSAVPSMEELGMGVVFRRIADLRRGLVLVTGPTGSGKSTTLAAMIDYVNGTRREHILTIEDPVEFIHHSKRCLVNQRQLGRDTESFAAALRAALREDPDVILIGEMRDPETIRLALTAAETGHLVFGTLHTSSAPQTVDRIVDVFGAGEKDSVRSMLAESLQAVVSQVLLKRAGGGRVAAHEVMLGTPAVRNLIREHKVAQLRSAIQTSAALGMQTLEQSTQRLAAAGLIAAATPTDLAAPLGH